MWDLPKWPDSVLGENFDQWETVRRNQAGIFSLISIDYGASKTWLLQIWASEPTRGFLTPWSLCCCSPSAHLTLGGLITWPCWHVPQAICCPLVSRYHTSWISLHACLHVSLTLSGRDVSCLCSYCGPSTTCGSQWTVHTVGYNHIFNKMWIPGLEWRFLFQVVLFWGGGSPQP